MTKSCYRCEAIVIVLQYERFQFHGAKTNKMNETNENEILTRARYVNRQFSAVTVIVVRQAERNNKLDLGQFHQFLQQMLQQIKLTKI